MANINFVSPGAAMTGALEQFMMQREAQRRQAMLDSLAAQREERLAANMEADDAFRRQSRTDAQKRQEAVDARQAEADAVAAQERSAAKNAEGVRRMIGDRVQQGPIDGDAARQIAGIAYGEGVDVPGIVSDALKPKAPERKHAVTVPGPNGRPVRKMVSEEELEAGVDEYREPKAGPTPNRVWVTRGGQPVFIDESQVQPGDTPYRQAPDKSNQPSLGYEKRALGFFNRARQADTDLEEIEAEIAGKSTLGQIWMNNAHNALQGNTEQKYMQAERAFTEARLRKDSGAAIPEHEFDNDRKTYFVQPGDTKEVVAQKRRARGALLASLSFESGRALPEFYGDEAGAMVNGYRQRAEATAGEVGRRYRNAARPSHGHNAAGSP